MEAGKDLGPRPDLVGGGLIRSLGVWSAVLSLRKQGEAEAYDERILGGGDFVQAVLEEADQTELRRSLCVYLYRELGIPLAEIARQVGVGTSGVAMAIKGL